MASLTQHTHMPRRPTRSVVRRGGSRIIWIGLLCGLVLQGQALAEGPATKVIKATIDKAIAILEDPALKKPERKEERRQMLIDIIGARFDFEEMGKRALGREWKNLNEPQRKEFVDLFTKLLVKSYAGRIEGYSGEQVEYLNERTKGNYAEVRTRVVSGKVEIPLYYRMINQSGDWRVYDVVADGVSLVRNYRGQFSKILDSESFEVLLKKLREKVEADDPGPGS